MRKSLTVQTDPNPERTAFANLAPTVAALMGEFVADQELYTRDWQPGITLNTPLMGNEGSVYIYNMVNDDGEVDQEVVEATCVGLQKLQVWADRNGADFDVDQFGQVRVHVGKVVTHWGEDQIIGQIRVTTNINAEDWAVLAEHCTLPYGRLDLRETTYWAGIAAAVAYEAAAEV